MTDLTPAPGSQRPALQPAGSALGARDLARRADDERSAVRPDRPPPVAIVLAAGKGTRMQSRRHKVLHPLAGKPMIWHVLRALQDAGLPPERTVVVVGESAPEVCAAIEDGFGAGRYAFAAQAPLLGTGHAVLQARPYVPAEAGTVLVAYGDTPLLRPATVRRLLEQHGEAAAQVTLVTGSLPDPSGYGRIIRDARGGVQAVVEEREATPEQLAVCEVNSGFCAFDPQWLWSWLPLVQPAPNGEIYLTALASLAAAEGATIATIQLDDIVEVLGVNTRAQLAEAEATLRQRQARRLLEAGVTLQDPATTYVDVEVEVGADTVILANTHLQGATTIGAACEIGPNAIIRNSRLADRCRVVASVLDGAVLDEGVTVGPFAHLRPGTRCGRAVEVGTGSEIKASSLGAGSRMHHFGYLGDAVVGEQVNIGAGTVTCNYDGTRKHQTHVGDRAFIGSDTLLVAPVRVGAGALTGAGAVVLHDVPDGAKVAGVPARQIGVRGEPKPEPAAE